MNSNSSSRTVRVATETQTLLRSHVLRHSQQFTRTTCIQYLMRSLKSVCILSKPVWLILAWTLIVSVIYTVLLFIAADFIITSVGLDTFSESNPLMSPFCITQAVLAVTAMLYPLSGFLADVWCGWFKAVMIGLSCLLFSIFVSVIILIWPQFSKGANSNFIVPFNKAAPFYVIGICLFPVILAGLALYYANFIQLGLDQLMEESSMHLSLFAHWAIWIEVLGTAIVAVCSSFIGCSLLVDIHMKVGILSSYT